MPAPSQLTIATSSVLRLLKEDVSYRKEAVDQEAQIKILEEKIKAGEGLADETNDEFMLKQQRTALDQTRAIFDPLKKRIDESVFKLEEQIAASEGTAPGTEIEQAKIVLAQAKVDQRTP